MSGSECRGGGGGWRACDVFITLTQERKMRHEEHNFGWTDAVEKFPFDYAIFQHGDSDGFVVVYYHDY